MESLSIRRRRLPLLLFAVLTVVGCDDTDPIAVDQDDLVTEQLEVAIADEYRAEAIYLRVLADFGDVLPFHNIVVAEERHSTALAGLFVVRGLDVPTSQWNVDNVPVFGTVTEACQAGVEAELANIGIYDRLLNDGLPVDVRQVFTSNRRASLERHLPAFRACS